MADGQYDLLNVKSGKYVMQVEDGSGCPTASSDTFNVADIGTITIDSANIKISPTSCIGETGSVTGIVVTGAEIYEWQDERGSIIANTPSLQHVGVGRYRLVTRNSAGCSAGTGYYAILQAVPEKMTVKEIEASPPTCGNTNGSITDVILTGGSPVVYQWLDSRGAVIADNKEAYDLSEGEYTLYVTDENNCRQEVTSVTLKAPVLPTLDEADLVVTNDQCNAGNGAIAGLKISGERPFSYTWYTGDVFAGNEEILSGVKQGQYYLVATDVYGCTVSSSTIAVDNTNIDPSTPAIDDIVIVRGMEALLQVKNWQKGTYNLYNTNNTTTPLYSNDTGIFIIPGINNETTFLINHQFGECIGSFGRVTVTVVDKTINEVPSAFSPNGDGVNDVFRIHAYGLQVVEYFTVFSRWGTPIFTTKDLRYGWDGTYNGRLMDSGGYVWIIKGKDYKGNSYINRGAVQLIR